MIPLDSYVDQTWKFEEESASDVTIFYGFPVPSSLALGSHYPATSPLSTAVNQVNLDPIGVEDPFSAFLASNLSFDSNEPDATFTSLDLTQGHISSGLEHGLGPVHTEEPVMNNVPQTSDGTPLCSPSSAYEISYPTNPDPQTLSFVQEVEDSFQTNSGPYAFSPVATPSPGWDIGHQETGCLSENPPTFDFADPAIGIDGSSYSMENIQKIDLEAAQSPPYSVFPSIEQQLIRSMQPVRICEWKDADGTVCRDLVTRATLPEHLSKHGIKNKTRNHPTKCNWVDCRRKDPLNRESIVRHIREVHLCMRRASKRVQKPVPNALAHRLNPG